jgi:hypothetical protein
MNVTYRDKVKQRGEGDVLVRQATKRLEEVLGPSAALVSAEWDQTLDERGRIRYVLKISDFSGEVSATFAAEELESPRQVRSRLLDLWGDFLQVRSDTQVKRLQELVKEGE